MKKFELIIKFGTVSPRSRTRMAITLTDEQKVGVSLGLTDAAGNAVDSTGVTSAWSSADTTLVTVTPNASDPGAEISSVGPVGNANVHVDVTLPDNTVISADVLVDVTTSEPTGVVIVAGTPEQR